MILNPHQLLNKTIMINKTTMNSKIINKHNNKVKIMKIRISIKNLAKNKINYLMSRLLSFKINYLMILSMLQPKIR